jgi:hypothetical protein
MVVAELEVFHSRPIAPTRRVALGDSTLPVSPHPGPGAVLLGAVMAANVAAIAPDLHDELNRLMTDVESGRRIPQPRLRHRFQVDRIGLQRSVHRLVGTGQMLRLELDDRGAPVQQALAAVYAVGTLGPGQRRQVMDVVRRGSHWRGDLGDRLLAHLAGRGGAQLWVGIADDPVQWARDVFGLTGYDDPDELDRRAVQRRFRQLLRDAHPDHGGATDEAARRIAELAEARRILLA